MQLVNWDLMREPLNWLIVILMLSIAAFGLHLVMGDDGAGAIGATGTAGLGKID